MPTTQLLAGLVLSAAIAWLAYRRNSLSRSGVAGAVITGTLIFGFGGWTWGLVLIAFFVSSTLLSHWRSSDKAGLAEKFAKGERRDLGQTLANGGFGALLAVAAFLLVDLPGEVRLGNPTYAFLALAYFGAMATVNADTWATELGVLASHAPRLITNGRRVTVGTSGGITTAGTLAALAGAAFIGICAFLFIQAAAVATTGNLLLSDLPLIGVAAVAGLAGSLVDSVLGATVQGIYWCAACQKETERRIHTCGAATEPLRGWGWLNNDLVNLVSSVAGGLLAAGLGLVILL